MVKVRKNVITVRGCTYTLLSCKWLWLGVRVKIRVKVRVGIRIRVRVSPISLFYWKSTQTQHQSTIYTVLINNDFIGPITFSITRVKAKVGLCNTTTRCHSLTPRI